MNLNDTSGVEKYVMPAEEYEKKSDSLLAWKRAEKLGRFNPEAPSLERAKVEALEREVRDRGIAVGRRCRVGGDDARRGGRDIDIEGGEIARAVGGTAVVGLSTVGDC